MLNFVNKHIDSIIAIEPRREPLETPIKDPVKETTQYGWNNWTIEKKGVDNV